MRPLVVMFDLENTIIDAWGSGVPHLAKIRTINQKLSAVEPYVKAYGIFSYAIDFEHEKPQGISLAEFAMHCHIDKQFVPCFKDLEACVPLDTAGLTKYDIVHVYGKSIMFPRYCNQFPDCDFILFDDALAFEQEVIQRTINGKVQTITMIRV